MRASPAHARRCLRGAARGRRELQNYPAVKAFFAAKGLVLNLKSATVAHPLTSLSRAGQADPTGPQQE
eukprot:818427-Alexandrium_andersonii.AAC.1